MELRFTRNSILNTVLRDTNGTPLYRIESPWKVRNRKTTISRILPGPYSPRGGQDGDDRVVAEILWQGVGQSVFIFGGQERKLREYMPRTGMLSTRRAFVASNGRSYKWVPSLSSCWSNEDGSDRRLAMFHRRTLGIIGKATNPWLEIAEEVVPVLDEVLMTFVWIERRREQRERQAQAGAGA
ncbi:hypothetical protein K488DRAFT_44305 [Vararia minispora EC-137]|uniref:Uncharacterized protein n=1 Tax=Vararia minispora EC-137 TaxID=1314806 RepID=A0ACB8QT58_9AGAM|nr:hypothetical protein K488DRAFT_44305 [Vararia minispora EC-137]